MRPETLKQIQESIKKAEEKLKELAEDIEKAKRAGIDVSESEKLYRELLRKVTLLKGVYMR